MSRAVSTPSDTSAGARRAARTVSSRLRAMVLATLVPALLLCLVAAALLYAEARASVTRGALETARALGIVVDQEMERRAAVLRALAASPLLEQEDLPAFHAQAQAVVADEDNVVVLVDLDGHQRLNTRRPPGTTGLPDAVLHQRDLEQPQARMLVSNLFQRPPSPGYYFAVQVPLRRQGELTGYLSMGSPASQLQRIFELQRLPDGWTGTVVDANGVAVARSSNAEKIVGRSASDAMLKHMAASREGAHDAVTLDGVEVVTSFSSAPRSGWRVLIAVPRAELLAPALRAAGAMLTISLVFAGIALYMAWVLARSIAQPVERLQKDAEALGRGELLAHGPTGLAETDAVRARLVQAAQERHEADERLERRVREALDESQRAQQAVVSMQKLEALGRLAGGIAHDFNNLLQAMTAGMHLALKRAQDPAVQQPLQACRQAVAKAVKLTRQLMTFGRMQPLGLETVDLHERLSGMRDLLRGALREDVALHLVLCESPWPVRADPVALELAVLNLVVNARDAIRGAGAVTLRLRNLPAGDPAALPGTDTVQLEVGDTGSGITAENLARVFEPFFTTKPVGEGTGLGLAQVYAFARQCGGAACIDSTPGAGTRVQLTLPRTEPAATVATAAARPASAPRRHAQVLVVEDDPLVAGTTGKGLEDMGHSVLIASSADTALSVLRTRQAGSSPFDVVVTDVVMPGAMNGVDLAREVRRSWPALPVVLVSGYLHDLQVEADLPQLAKPYEMAEMERVLERVLQPAAGSVRA